MLHVDCRRYSFDMNFEFIPGSGKSMGLSAFVLAFSRFKSSCAVSILNEWLCLIPVRQAILIFVNFSVFVCRKFQSQAIGLGFA